MKKIILFLVMTIFTLIIFAQPKYGYIVAYNNSSHEVAVSKIIDLTKLDCSTTSRNNQYGKKDLVDYYTECSSTWFNKKLSSLGYNVNTFSFMLTWDSRNGYNPGCVNKNETACFFSTVGEAQNDKDKFETKWRAKYKVNEVE